MVERALAGLRLLAEAWGVDVDGWLGGGTCSLVLTGRRGGEEVVLRVPLYDWERDASLPTMRAFSGHGGVPILASDEATGAALMPRLRPGTPLGLDDEEAIEVCIDLVRRLRGAQGDAPRLDGYLADLAGPPSMVVREGFAEDVRRLAAHLFETSPPPRLLHADLHHFNILRHGEGWVAIDPEGALGDPTYEFAAFLRNPVPEYAFRADLDAVLRRRIRRFSEALGDPPERIWGWALVRTALCVWVGTSAFHEPWLRVLNQLDGLRTEFGA